MCDQWLYHKHYLVDTLRAYLPRILKTKVTSDDLSKQSEAQGIDPRQLLALIDPLDRSLRLQVPWSCNPRSPQISDSNVGGKYADSESRDACGWRQAWKLEIHMIKSDQYFEYEMLPCRISFSHSGAGLYPCLKKMERNLFFASRAPLLKQHKHDLLPAWIQGNLRQGFQGYQRLINWAEEWIRAHILLILIAWAPIASDMRSKVTSGSIIT